MKEPNIQIFCQEDQTIWIIRRHPRGHLTGYIALPESHICYNDEQERNDYEVHGGVTWDGKVSPTRAIFSHPDFKFRFIGFDCNHIGDYFDDSLREEDCREFDDLMANAGIKDVPFVYAELEKLAKQIEDRARQLRTAQFSEPSRSWMRDLANGKTEYGDFETLRIKVSEGEEA